MDILIVTSGMLTGLSMTGLTPVLPHIEAELGTPGAETGSYLVKMIVAIVGLSIMLAAPLSEVIGRRFRCGTVLIVSFTAFAGASIVSSLAPTLELLVAARFVQGIGVAIGVTTLLALAATLYPGTTRDRLLGLHMGGSAFALLVLLPVAGILGDIDWRLAPLLGLLALFHLALAICARRELSFNLGKTSGRSIPLTGEELRQAALVGALSFLIGAVIYSGPAFVPFKLVAVGIASAMMIGLIGTLAVATSALSSFSYALVASRLSRPGVYLFALPCCGLGALLVAVADVGWIVAMGQLVSGVGGGLIVAHIYADSAERFRPELRARTTGLIKSSSFAGLFVGPLLLQFVVAHASINAAFVAIALGSGLALAAALSGRSRPSEHGRGRQ
ncbi:MFS transporter [Croceicoccus estronivorus]|uniref:MFS transporter n=1 Tax=Croceicoccus estronivorus TaxID=1172626 RepID=UPI000A502D5A|nr:MFS transporter [Croceicoccus estronivorus]